MKKYKKSKINFANGLFRTKIERLKTEDIVLLS